MTLSAHGFPGSVTDVAFAELMSLLGNDGTSGFNVSAADGDRTVSVSSGISNVGGVLIRSTATETRQLPQNGSSYPRIDRVVLRARWSDGLYQITYRQGTPSPNPQPPDLSPYRTAGVEWEVPIAQVRLESGQGALTSGSITRTNTPPESGFYYVTSIAQAPYEPGSLFYYAPDSSLRVKTANGDIEIASLRTSAFVELPDPPPNWAGLVRYVKCNRWVSVSVDLRRTGNSTSADDVKLGVLPAGYRPPIGWYGSVVNQAAESAFPLQVGADGQVWALHVTVGQDYRLRGGVTFPIN